MRLGRVRGPCHIRIIGQGEGSQMEVVPRSVTCFSQRPVHPGARSLSHRVAEERTIWEGTT